ncbi:hypothetical protein JCM8208_003402 [Rhodotorula glutinis]
MRRDSVPPTLASILLLLLALLPPALADKAPALDSTRFHLVKVKHRLKQSQRPHWSHRAPGTKRQSPVQGLLCSLGITAACEGDTGPAIDTSSDPQNCGSIGNACPSSFPDSAGPVACQSGQCVSSCILGFSFDVATSSCINTATDTLNCGRVGRVCSTPTGAAAVTCLAGFCLATSCTSGYSYRGGACAVVPFSSDASNCGRPGLVCPAAFENGRGSVCVDGTCRAETCDEGYEWDGETGACRRPEREDGCASLATAADAPRRGDPRTVAELLRAFAAEMAASRGGYECIDVRQEVDSCGGCATLGEGRDCTTDVPHATSTGCDAGACVVFACERGWKPDREAARCIRSEGRGGRKHGKVSTARRGRS